MNILFLSDNFPPENNAPAFRTYEHCKEWVKLGHEVTVVTCFPNYPQGKVFSGYTNKLISIEYKENIKIVRLWTYMSQNTGVFRRILDHISFSFSSFIYCLFKKTDLFIATSPQFFTTFSACILSFLKRKPWVFEVRDLWPDTIAAVGILSRDSFLFKFLEKIEIKLYKSAEKIVVVTDNFKYDLIRRGINDKKIFIIKNGIDNNVFYPRPLNVSLRKKLKIHKKIVVGYIGTIGMTHGLSKIIDFANKIKYENYHFLFIGDGAEKNKLIRKTNLLNLNNVTFIKSVKRTEIPKYISAINISLVNLKKDETFKHVIPSKIFENASMLKPILLGVDGEAKELVNNYKIGIPFEPENFKSFRNSLIRISNFDKTILIKSRKKLIKDFDRQKLAKKMLEIILR